MDSDIQSKKEQYQLGLFLHSLYNSLKYSKWKFQLGRDVDIPGTFNDIVIKHKNWKEEKYICCQVNYSDDLDLGRNLKEYFLSYLRIIDQFKGTNQVLEKSVLFTNAQLDESIISSRNCSEFNFTKLLEVEENLTENFIKFDENSEIYKELIQTKTDFDVLVEILSKFSIKNDEIMTLDDSYVKYYQTALIDEKILLVKSTEEERICKFHEDFRNNTNLSEIAQKFRNCILEKTNAISEICWKVDLTFGLKYLDDSIKKEIIQNLVDYIKRSDENQFQFKALNENYLSYYYLELIDLNIFVLTDNSILIFPQDFILNQCNSYCRNFRNNVINHLKFNENDFQNRLKEISFILTPNLDENNFLKPLVKFPSNDNITAETIKAFLGILELKINQPNVEHLFHNKFKIEDAKQIANYVTKWIKEIGDAKTWIPNRFVKRLLNDLRNQIALNKVNELTKNFNKCIDDRINLFNINSNETINGLDSFLENFSKNILYINTDETLLTAIKLREYLKSKFSNQYIFFNYNTVYKKNIKHILRVSKIRKKKFIFIYIENLTNDNVKLLKDLTEVVLRKNKKIISIISGMNENLPMDDVSKVLYLTDNNIDCLEDIAKMETVIKLTSKLKFLNKETLSFSLERKFVHDTSKRKFTLKKLLETNEKYKTIIIHGTPGLGKSTVFYQLQKAVRKPMNFIARINLIEHSHKFQSILDNNAEKDETFLQSILSLSKYIYDIIISGSDKTVNTYLFLDTFDEICPDHTELVITFIKKLQKTFVTKIFIATESNVLDKLTSNLNDTVVYNLENLSETEQFDFINEEFRKKFNENYSERLKIYIKQLLIHDFSFTPLNLKMLCEISYENSNGESCEEFLKGNHEVPNLSVNINFSNIYENYVEVKLKQHLLNLNIPMTDFNKFVEVHKEIALKIMLQEKDVDKEFRLVSDDEFDMEEYNFGLVHNFTFVHKTFMEYFAALCIRDYLINPNKSLIIFKLIVDRCLIEEKFRGTRSFLNCLICDIKYVNIDLSKYNKNSLKIAISEQNSNIVKYLIDNNVMTGKRFGQELFLVATKTKSIDIIKQLITYQLNQTVPNYFQNINEQTNLNDIDLEYSTALHYAASKNNVKLTEMLLKQNPLINLQNDYGLTPLHTAVIFENQTVLDILLKNKPNLNCQDNSLSTPIHWAIITKNEQITKTLLKHNYQSNITNDQNESYLFLATTNKWFEIVKQLLSNKANPDFQENLNGLTALHVAATNNSIEILQELLSHEADLNMSINTFEITPLFAAVQNNSIECVKELLHQNADPNIPNTQDGLTPLWVATQNNIVKELLLHQAQPNTPNKRDNTTALHLAVENNDFNIVETLLIHGANPNIGHKYSGITPLHVASENNFVNIVKILLEYGANPNFKSKDGSTALYIAVVNDCFEVVKELIVHQADPNLQGKDGVTPLHAAARNNSIPIVKELIICKADPNIRSYNQSTALFESVQNKSIDIVKELLIHQAHPNLQYYGGITLLQMAVENDSIDIVKELLIHQANPNVAYGLYGTTPLLTAARNNSICIVKELLIHQANPDVADDHGTTPLYLAAINNSIDIAIELLKHGADPSILDMD